MARRSLPADGIISANASLNELVEKCAIVRLAQKGYHPGMFWRLLRWIFSSHVFKVAALFLAAVGVAMGLAPNKDDILRAHWFFGAAFVLAAGRIAYWLMSEQSLTPKPIIAAVSFALIGGSWMAVYQWVEAKLPPAPMETPEKPKLPDITLRFVYPKSPALVLANPSDSIARDIKYSVVLWNMDVPERDDPLPIPVATFDWLKPHTEGGPQDLFGSPPVASLLNGGNRLIGVHLSTAQNAQ